MHKRDVSDALEVQGKQGTSRTADDDFVAQSATSGFKRSWVIGVAAR